MLMAAPEALLAKVVHPSEGSPVPGKKCRKNKQRRYQWALLGVTVFVKNT